MATLKPLAATGVLAGSLVAGGLLSSLVVQRAFGARIRELPDESVSTQVIAVAVTVVILSLTLNLGGIVFYEMVV